ncbi:hypothetical protein VP1G_03044 [Cytospora mali]|uniref:Uncharacterized protein n=1 Tax=Cytospora mali TaxID=578113 RepID=A0A194UVI3_CYTMA|nr:hypothetical protein VP1G_03044 [Valsa mali var. pyri (nom. inval.)]
MAPPVPPPGLGFSAHSHPSRTTTPSQPPPGITTPQMHTVGGTVPIAAPTPVIPLKFAVPASPASVAESSKASKKSFDAITGAQAKKNIKALAVDSGLSKEIASHATTSAKGKKPVLQDEDFPALESAKPVSRASTPVPAKAPSIKTPMVVKKVQAEIPKATSTPAPETPVQIASTPKAEKKAEKRIVPGVLNIAAATRAAAATRQSNPPSTVTSAVERSDDAAFPALPTPSSISSPAARAAPKTLRVVSTPKAETPIPMSAVPVAPLALRHGLSGSQRPETPGSVDINSDSASIRKARKEATKKEAVAIATQAKQEAEVEIAPIVGRKKKQKKEPKSAASKETTPATESRPESPGPAEKDKHAEKEENPPVEEKVSTYRQAVNESMSLEEPLVPRSRRKDGNVSSTGEPLKPAVDRPLPSPAAVLQVLVQQGLITDVEALALLKTVTSTSHRSEQYAPVIPKDGVTEVKLMVTEEDQQALLSGNPVRKIVDGSRVLFTPNGNCVRNLSPAEEARYLELQASIAAKADDPAAYVHSRHEQGNGFSVIKGRAVANGTPSYFPQGSAAPTADGRALPTVSDPLQKMTREEALANINQSILPRLNLGTANLNNLAGVQDPNNVKGQTQNVPQTTPTLANATSALNSLAPLILNFASSGSPGSTAALAAELSGQPAGSSLAQLDPTDEFSGMANTMINSPLPTMASAGKALGSSVPALANFPMLSLEDMEQAFTLAKKEAEKMEKSLNQTSTPTAVIAKTSGGGRIRRREMLQRGIARVGLVASRACFGFDGVLGVSCGFALRATVAAFVVLGAVLEKVVVLSFWMAIRTYTVGMWTLKALVALLDWVGATY